MTQASDTPRTDAVVDSIEHWYGAETGTVAVMAEHARQLERELAAARRDALEEAAVIAWSAGMDAHSKARGLPQDAREVGSNAASHIRTAMHKDKEGK